LQLVVSVIEAAGRSFKGLLVEICAFDVGFPELFLVLSIRKTGLTAVLEKNVSVGKVVFHFLLKELVLLVPGIVVGPKNGPYHCVPVGLIQLIVDVFSF